MKINGFKTLVSMAAALSILLSNGIPFVCTPVNADTVSANGTHNVEIDVPDESEGSDYCQIAGQYYYRIDTSNVGGNCTVYYDYAVHDADSDTWWYAEAPDGQDNRRGNTWIANDDDMKSFVFSFTVVPDAGYQLSDYELNYGTSIGGWEKCTDDNNSGWIEVSIQYSNNYHSAAMIKASAEVIPVTYTVTYDEGEHGTIYSWISKSSTVNSSSSILLLSSFAVKADSDYTFTGWLDANTGSTYSAGSWITVSGNMNLVAQYKIKSRLHDIKYDNVDGTDNSQINPSTYNEYEGITLKDPTKEGSIFTGWSLRTGRRGNYVYTNVGKNYTIAKGTTSTVNLRANWQDAPVTYTVTLEDASGSNLSVVSGAINAGGTYRLDAGFTRENYTLAGWTESDGSAAQYQPGESITVNRDITLYAVWTANTYTVTYNAGSGSGTEYSVSAAYLEDVIVPTFSDSGFTPAEGHEFSYWSDRADGTGTVYAENEELYVEGDITLYAQYGALNYTVRYSCYLNTYEEAAVYGEQHQLMDAAVEAPEGYYLAAWKSGSNSYIPGGTAEIKGDLNLTADYQPITYSITYDGLEDATFGGDQTNPNPESYTIEDSIEIVNPERSGYEFIGWSSSTSPDMNMNYSIDKMFGDIELTANWMKNCTVSFDGNGATLPSDIFADVHTHVGDSVKIPLQEPTRTGFAFCGWSVNAASTIVDYYPDQELQADDDTTLYAIWALEYYNIDYVGAGDLYEPDYISFTVNDTITINNPTLDDKTFIGWTIEGSNERPNKNLTISNHAGNIKLVANWQDKVSVIYEADGNILDYGDYVTSMYDLGTEVSVAGAVEKENFTFVEWLGSDGNVYNPGDIIDLGGNITLTAVYKAEARTITYHDSLNVNADVVVNTYYGAEVSVNKGSIFDNPGYEFFNWYDDNNNETYDGDQNIQVADSLILNAQWNAIEYSITYAGSNCYVAGNPDTYTVEDSITISNPTCDGYEFTGWTSGNGSTPAENMSIAAGTTGDITLTANWSAVNYQLDVDLNGGSVSVTAPVSYTIESEDICLETPVLEGYTFTGWSGTGIPENTTSQNVCIGSGSTGDRSYKANWQINSYSISLEANNGSGDYNISSYNYGSIVTLDSTMFSYEGHTFVEYNSEPDGNGDIYANPGAVSVTGDLTLYAIWKSNYAIIDGNDTQITIGSDSFTRLNPDGMRELAGGFETSFTSNAPFPLFTGVSIDDEDLNQDQFSSEEGCTIVRITRNVLEGYGAGSHKITIKSTDGSASTTFTIFAAAATPTAAPTSTVTPTPTAAPTSTVTPTPTAVPTSTVTSAPTAVPTAAVTSAPTAAVTAAPTAATAAPTVVAGASRSSHATVVAGATRLNNAGASVANASVTATGEVMSSSIYVAVALITMAAAGFIVAIARRHREDGSKN